MACDMSKLANFSTEKQQLIALGIDTYTGDVANYVAKDVDTSAGSMDDVMRDRFNKDILHGEKYNYRTYRKYKNDIFEILETVLDQTLPEGWSENEFFNRFVETVRVDLGDKNEFYAEDNGNFIVSKFSGNHWDTIRERMDMGKSFSIETSWWEVHFYNEFERFMKNIDSWTKLMDKARKSRLTSLVHQLSPRINILHKPLKLIVEMNFPPRSFNREGLAHVHTLTNSIPMIATELGNNEITIIFSIELILIA